MITIIADKLQKYLLPVANKIGSNRYLLAIKDAFLISLPFTMFGSIILALVNIPFLNKLIAEDTIAAIQAAAAPIQNVTFNVIAVIVVLGIGYSLGKYYKSNPIYTAISSLIGFLMVTPTTTLFEENVVTGVYELNNLGTMAIFSGIIMAILCTETYRWVVEKNLVIKMPDSVPQLVADSFSSFIPVGAVLSISFIIQLGFSFTGFQTMNAFIYEMIQIPISRIGSSFTATMIAGALCNLFWFFGLHGNSIVYNSVLSPIFKALYIENLAAFQAHKMIPNVITEEFAFYFGGFNGSFIAYPILICIIIFFKKKKEWKKLAEVSMVPGIFSIYEPIVFGLPLMLNPIMLIPMLLTPMLSCAISYFAMTVGLVPLCTGVSIPWTTPMILSGIITTNSLQGGILQIVIIAVLTVLWYVFLKIAYNGDKDKEKKIENE